MEKIKIKTVDLSRLSQLTDFVFIRCDNSPIAIEEFGGSDSYIIKIETKSNSAVIHNNESDSITKRFLDTFYADVYEGYTESKQFLGIYDISSVLNYYEEESTNSKAWYISSQGFDIEDYSDSLNNEQLDFIISIINPNTVFQISVEIISELRKMS